MGKLFRNMDFLKGMILFSVVALAGLGVWDLVLGGKLEDARKSFERSKKDVVQIHALLKQIAPLYTARTQMEMVGGDHGVYFERQLTHFGGIPLQSYSLSELKRVPVTLGRKKAVDKVLRIDFGRRAGRKDRLFLPRENLFTALYSCERESRSWRMRKLRIKSRDEIERKGRREDGYPDEIKDEWFVEELEFASREPVR